MRLVEEIRTVSRRMVRELGFMGEDFAGTDLPPSAVHALIEIEKGGATARDLGTALRLEKSSVSRMLRKMIEAGDVTEEASAGDSRIKLLALTASGKQRVEAVHDFARRQVNAALAHLQPVKRASVLEGLSLYTEALGAVRNADATSPAIDVTRGYETGLLARTVEMHANYYARESGFGQPFESLVAGEMAEFCNRLDHRSNAIWVGKRGGDIIGSIAIDGEHMGPGKAHLRWFIVDDGVRGAGLGRRLISAALAFADERGFEQTHLWTFEGLLAARRLYESMGFVCVEERPGTRWGREVLEQRFARVRPPQ